MTLQEQVMQQAQGGGISAKALLDYSRLYRAALHECVQGLRAEDQDRDLVVLYTHLELAWHLCEVMFIENLHAGCLIQQLQEWVVYNASKLPLPLLPLPPIISAMCDVRIRSRAVGGGSGHAYS